MSEELERLIERARTHVWTDEERRQNIISFAYGNVKLHNPKVSLEDIERAYDELEGR